MQLFYIIVTDILKYSNELQVAKNFRKRAECFRSGKSHISFKFLKTFINILESSPFKLPKDTKFCPTLSQEAFAKQIFGRLNCGHYMYMSPKHPELG